MHRTRTQRLRARLGDAGLDALLVTTAVNVRYLTGFTGSVAALLVPAGETTSVLAVDDRYAEQARAETEAVELVVTRTDDWLAERAGTGRVGLESNAVPWDRVRSLAELLPGEVVPAPGHVEALRERKDPAELAAIRRACAITDEAFTSLCGWLAPGVSERGVARWLQHTLTGLGAHDRAFEMIVAGGPNSARPHHRPGERAIAAGDLLKVDFGALVDGYHADMTRTLALGDPDPELARVHELVRAANEAGLAAVTDGASAGAVDAACRDTISAAGYGERFTHSTGHGVGLQIHEAPSLRPDGRATLRAGMAVTVEPGVYLPGLGGVRIEDTVAVTGGEADVLTRSSKDLVRL